jgi:hypothetical protein
MKLKFLGAALLCLAAVVQAQQQTVTAQLTLAVNHWVELSWTASPTPGVVGYKLYRSKTPGGPYLLANGTIIKGVRFNDVSVLAGEKWCYVVAAVASDGITESDHSNEACATLPTP